jgi:hypothetical protein
MEVMLRCTVPDRPGALAALAGAVGEAGGDIQAVEVVETADGIAVDDLVVVIEPGALKILVERLEAAADLDLVHVGPSRGHPGGAVARFALGLQSLLDGAMTTENALTALVGGALRAERAELVELADAPPESEHVFVFDAGDRALVIHRPYRLNPSERQRAEAILSACREIVRVRA